MRRRRYLQDAVIGMAILVVILALWRLHSRPKWLGGLGDWAATNIFGAATLGLIPRPGQSGGTAEPPLEPPTPESGFSNQADFPSTGTNPPPATVGAGRSPSSNSAPSTNFVSTNLINTNGPVTVIAVAPSDLVQTPPGVAAASNVPEAAAIERRLGEVNAKGGDIQISLSWHNYNDLDLHCIDPAGVEIFFGNRVSSRTGGELDVDQNAHLPYNNTPVENIFWPFDGAPAGLYRISVVYYAPHCDVDSTPFLVRTVVQGKTNYFRSTISYTGPRERRPICNLRYDPDNPDAAQRLKFVQ
jgi:hypothetical protein